MQTIPNLMGQTSCQKQTPPINITSCWLRFSRISNAISNLPDHQPVNESIVTKSRASSNWLAIIGNRYWHSFSHSSTSLYSDDVNQEVLPTSLLSNIDAYTAAVVERPFRVWIALSSAHDRETALISSSVSLLNSVGKLFKSKLIPC